MYILSSFNIRKFWVIHSQISVMKCSKFSMEVVIHNCVPLLYKWYLIPYCSLEVLFYIYIYRFKYSQTPLYTAVRYNTKSDTTRSAVGPRFMESTTAFLREMAWNLQRTDKTFWNNLIQCVFSVIHT